MEYIVSHEKGGHYFVHHKGYPEYPIPGSHGDKKHALKFAARHERLSLKEYLKIRKQEGNNE